MPINRDEYGNKLGGETEFFAPDSFNRDSLYCYVTADNAVAAKGVKSDNTLTVAANNGCFAIADYADSTAYGLANVCVSGVDTVRDSIGEIQGQIKTLSAAIEELKERLVCVPQTKNRMSKLRRELKTLRGAP